MAHLFYLVCVWFHLMFAAMWIGGMLFLTLVAVPLLKKPEFKESYLLLFSGIGRRFRTIGWVSLAGLVFTGILQIYFRGYSLPDLWQGSALSNTFGSILRVKFSVVAVVLTISALHDFWIGPTAVQSGNSSATGSNPGPWRTLASWIGRANLILAFIVLALAVLLVRGLP